MANELLVDYQGLAAVTGQPVRRLRTLAGTRKIPLIKLGHRTVLFQPSKVMAALERFEIKAVGDR